MCLARTTRFEPCGHQLLLPVLSCKTHRDMVTDSKSWSLQRRPWMGVVPETCGNVKHDFQSDPNYCRDCNSRRARGGWTKPTENFGVFCSGPREQRQPTRPEPSSSYSRPVVAQYNQEKRDRSDKEREREQNAYAERERERVRQARLEAERKEREASERREREARAERDRVRERSARQEAETRRVPPYERPGRSALPGLCGPVPTAPLPAIPRDPKVWRPDPAYESSSRYSPQAYQANPVFVRKPEPAPTPKKNGLRFNRTNTKGILSRWFDIKRPSSPTGSDASFVCVDSRRIENTSVLASSTENLRINPHLKYGRYNPL
jgi:hypothetical protein